MYSTQAEVLPVAAVTMVAGHLDEVQLGVAPHNALFARFSSKRYRSRLARATALDFLDTLTQFAIT